LLFDFLFLVYPNAVDVSRYANKTCMDGVASNVALPFHFRTSQLE